MKYNTLNSRPVGRQLMIDRWFAKFVAAELYEKDQYYEFCKRVKGKTQLEIERIFKTERQV
jgi:hypothetical protein